METIDSFKGEYDWLSNFYEYDNTTAEHIYQSEKTDDKEWKEKILKASTPGKAKRIGSKSPLRPGWDSIRYDVMIETVRNKFQNPELRDKLIKTYPATIIEGNHWHDNYWGNCQCDKCKNVTGMNMLGFILMSVRSELINERYTE